MARKYDKGWADSDDDEGENEEKIFKFMSGNTSETYIHRKRTIAGLEHELGQVVESLQRIEATINNLTQNEYKESIFELAGQLARRSKTEGFKMLQRNLKIRSNLENRLKRLSEALRREQEKEQTKRANRRLQFRPDGFEAYFPRRDVAKEAMTDRCLKDITGDENSPVYLRQTKPIGVMNNESMTDVIDSPQYILANRDTKAISKMMKVYKDLTDIREGAFKGGAIRENKSIEANDMDGIELILDEQAEKMIKWLSDKDEINSDDVQELSRDINEFRFIRHEILNKLVCEGLGIVYGSEIKVEQFLTDTLLKLGMDELYNDIMMNRIDSGDETKNRYLRLLRDSLDKTPDYIGPMANGQNGYLLMDVSVGMGSDIQTRNKARKYAGIADALTYFGILTSYLHLHYNMQNRVLIPVSGMQINIEVEYPIDRVLGIEDIIVEIRKGLNAAILDELDEVLNMKQDITPFLTQKMEDWGKDFFNDAREDLDDDTLQRLKFLIDGMSSDSVGGPNTSYGNTAKDNIMEFCRQNSLSFSDKKLEVVDEQIFSEALKKHLDFYNSSYYKTTKLKVSIPVMYAFGIRMTEKERARRDEIIAYDSKHGDMKYWAKIIKQKYAFKDTDKKSELWVRLLRELFKVYMVDSETYQGIKTEKMALDEDGGVIYREEINVKIKNRTGVQLGPATEKEYRRVGYKKSGKYGMTSFEGIYAPIEPMVINEIKKQCGIEAKKKNPDEKSEKRYALDFNNLEYEIEFEKIMEETFTGKTYGDLHKLMSSMSKGFTNLMVVSNYHNEFKLVHTGDIRNIILACPSGGIDTKEGDILYVCMTLLPSFKETSNILGFENNIHTISFFGEQDLEKTTLYISKPFRLTNNRIEGLRESLSNFETMTEIISNGISVRNDIEKLYRLSKEGETKISEDDKQERRKILDRIKTEDVVKMNDLCVKEDEEKAGVSMPEVERPLFEKGSNYKFERDSKLKDEYVKMMGLIVYIILNQNQRTSNFLESARYMLLNCIGSHSGVHHYLTDALVKPCNSLLDCYLMRRIIQAAMFNIRGRSVYEKTGLVFQGLEMVESARTYVRWPMMGLTGIVYNNPTQLTKELSGLFFCHKKGLHPDLLNKSKMATNICRIQLEQDEFGTEKGGLNLEGITKGSRSDYSYDAIIAATYMCCNELRDKHSIRESYRRIMESTIISHPTFVSSKSELSELSRRNLLVAKIRACQEAEVTLVHIELERLTAKIETLTKGYGDMSSDMQRQAELEVDEAKKLIKVMREEGVTEQGTPEQWLILKDMISNMNDEDVYKELNNITARNLKSLESILKKEKNGEQIFKDLKLIHSDLVDYKLDKSTKEIISIADIKSKDAIRLRARLNREPEDIYVRDKVVNVTACSIEEERLMGEQNYTTANYIEKKILNDNPPIITYDSKKQRTPDDREIYIGDAKSKAGTFAVESLFSQMCRQLNGEMISVSGNEKMLHIMSSVKKINQFEELRKNEIKKASANDNEYHESQEAMASDGLLGTLSNFAKKMRSKFINNKKGKIKNIYKFFSNLDMTKWSPKDNMYKFLYVIATLDFLTKMEKTYLMRILLHMSRKKLYLDPSLLLKLSSRELEEVHDKSVYEMTNGYATSFVRINFNWFQGFFNYLSSFVHYGATLLLKEALYDKYENMMYIPLVHSDDHCSMFVAETDEDYGQTVNYFIDKLTTIFRLCTMEPSIKKSYISQDTAELVSERNVHGVQEADWAKPIMAAESALPCSSIKDDMSAVISKIQDSASRGAPMTVIKTALRRHISEVREMYGIDRVNDFSREVGVPKERLPQYMGGDYHGSIASLILGAGRASDGYTLATCMADGLDPIADTIKRENSRGDDAWKHITSDGKVNVDMAVMKLLYIGLWQTVEGCDVVRADITGGVNPILMTAFRNMPTTKELAYDYRKELYKDRIDAYEDRRSTANVLKPRINNDIPTWLMRLYTRRDFLSGLKGQNSTHRMLQRRLQNKKPIGFIKKLIEDGQDISVNYYMASNSKFNMKLEDDDECLNDVQRITEEHKQKAITINKMAKLYSGLLDTLEMDENKFKELCDFLYYPYQIVQLDKSLSSNELCATSIDRNIVRRPCFSPNISYGSTFQTPITLLLQYIFDRKIYKEENPDDPRKEVIELDATRMSIELGGLIDKIAGTKELKRKIIEQIMRSYTTRTGRMVFMFKGRGMGIVSQYLEILGAVVGDPYFVKFNLIRPWVMDKGRLRSRYIVEQVNVSEAAKCISNIVLTNLVLSDVRDGSMDIYRQTREILDRITVGSYSANDCIESALRDENKNIARIMLPISCFMTDRDKTNSLLKLVAEGRLSVPQGMDKLQTAFNIYYHDRVVSLEVTMLHREIVRMRVATEKNILSIEVSSAISRAINKIADSYREISTTRATLVQPKRVAMPESSAPGMFYLQLTNRSRDVRLRTIVARNDIIASFPVLYYYREFNIHGGQTCGIQGPEYFKGVVYKTDINDVHIKDGFPIIEEEAVAIEQFFMKRSDRTAYTNAVFLKYKGKERLKPMLAGINGIFDLEDIIDSGYTDWIPNKYKPILLQSLLPCAMLSQNSRKIFCANIMKHCDVKIQHGDGSTSMLSKISYDDIGYDYKSATMILPDVELPRGNGYQGRIFRTLDLCEKVTIEQSLSSRITSITFSKESDSIRHEEIIDKRYVQTADAWSFFYNLTRRVISDERLELVAGAIALMQKDKEDLLDVLTAVPDMSFCAILSHPDVISNMMLLCKSSKRLEELKTNELMIKLKDHYDLMILYEILQRRNMRKLSSREMMMLRRFQNDTVQILTNEAGDDETMSKELQSVIQSRILFTRSDRYEREVIKLTRRTAEYTRGMADTELDYEGFDDEQDAFIAENRRREAIDLQVADGLQKMYE